jgi:hypothetical protein
MAGRGGRAALSVGVTLVLGIGAAALGIGLTAL